MDAIVGCSIGIFFLEDLVIHIQHIGRVTLLVGDPLGTFIWNPSWLSAHLLEHRDDLVPFWNKFTLSLSKAHIRLVNSLD